VEREDFMMFKVGVVCAACLLYFNTSQASDTTVAIQGGYARTLALGGSPTNYFLTDYTDIYINPAYIEQYSNLVCLELGTGFSSGSGFSANNQFYGAIYALEKVTLGLTVGKREGPMFSENSYGYQSGGYFSACDYMKSALDSYLQNILVQSSNEPLTPLQLIAGFSVGDVSLGIALYESNWSREDDGTGTVSLGRKCSAALSQYGIKAGVLYPFTEASTLDLAGCFRLNYASSSYSDNNTNAPITESSFSASGYELSIVGRLFYKISPRLSIVPLGRAELFFYKPEVNSKPQSNYLIPLPNSYSKWECELGAGLQSRWENGLAVIGLSVQYIALKNDAVNYNGTIHQTTRYSRSWFDLPKINAGVEYSIVKWLLLRGGFFKRISTQRTRIEAPSPLPPIESDVTMEPGFIPSFGLSSSEQTLSLGVGIVIDHFVLNGYLAEQVLGKGIYLISGMQQNLFGVVSLNYHF
jgi:hypothetical protein